METGKSATHSFESLVTQPMNANVQSPALYTLSTIRVCIPGDVEISREQDGAGSENSFAKDDWGVKTGSGAF